MSSKPKDHTKTIATMKSVIGDLKKSVNKITKEKEKEAEQATERATPEDHQAALQHFATQYKMAKVNKDDAAAADHARAYHDYAHKLSNIYHKKLKEDMDICNICKVDPCVCDESHGFVNEGKMGEKAAGDLDFHPEIKNDDPPFDKPYKRKPATVTDKSGAKHTALSRVRDLARRSLKKEEVEQVDELNVMTLSRYASKARSQSMDKNNPKRYKRGSGAAKAYDKIHRGEYSEGHVPDHSGVLNKSDAGTMSKVAALMAKERQGKSVPKKPTGEYDRKVTSYLKKKYQKEEVEQVDEISKELANRYMYSAFSDRKKTDDKMLDLQNKQSEGGKFFRSHKKISKLLAKSNNRTTGISRALDRLQKEEVEQVNEISDKAKQNYLNAARKDREELAPQKRAPDRDQANWARKKDDNRRAGINKVKSHLTPGTVGHAKVQARRMGEEVEQFDEAVTVDKKKYSWGKMITVHHGSDTSYPLHPEHQAAIKKLRPGMKTTFKDETGRQIHAHREGDQVHLVHHNTGSSTAKKTTVGYHHFDESYNPYDLHEIKMSDDEYSKNVENYGKRATNLLKHSWSQHDVSKEKEKAGDKAGAEKAKSTGSRAHKLFLKAWKKHESKPGNKEKAIQRTMSGASDYYRSKKPGQYTGD